MTKDEALKLALAAIESEGWCDTEIVITAIKQALALDKKAENARELGLDYEPCCKDQTCPKCKPAPVQPVAWVFRRGLIQKFRWNRDKPVGQEAMLYWEPLYTTPPAQPAPVQERTDYEVHLNHCNIGECEGVCKYLDDDCPALKHADMKAKWDRPTPPAAQRQWVGLTDNEKIDCASPYDSRLCCVEATEAKLKEKNT